MNKTTIMTNLQRTFSKTTLKLKKHSPEILVVTGIVGVVTSTVMACKATTKLDAILEESKADIDKIHEVMEHPELVNCEYTEEDGKKDLTIKYVQTGVAVAKLYAPAVAVGALSITSILAGHNILRKRNVALAAAYSVIDKSFKDYRGRVVERFGKELDRELKYNIKTAEIEETIVDEKGKEKTVKKTVEVLDPNTVSDYARFFDAGNAGWDDNPEFNLMFLKKQQNFANQKLQTEGYLFLNDVYEMLGIPKTSAGQVVGWVYDEKHPIGDNFVDFGLYDIHKEKTRDFVNGYEKVILLDFNVDGNILDFI